MDGKYTVDIMESAITALETDLCISRQTTKIRLVKFGFEEAIGTFTYLGGHYVKLHDFRNCFWCTVVEGSLELKEHEAARWLDRENLYSVDWLPADTGLIAKIEKLLT